MRVQNRFAPRLDQERVAVHRLTRRHDFRTASCTARDIAYRREYLCPVAAVGTALFPRPSLASVLLSIWGEQVEAIGPGVDVLELLAVDRKAVRFDVATKIDQSLADRRDIPALEPDSQAITGPGGRDRFQRGRDLLDRDPIGQRSSSAH
jgi:hypothetical protein